MKPGYKQAEAGVIPEDWEEISLGQLAEIRMCKRIFSEQTSLSGDIPFFKIGTFGKAPDAFISASLYHEYKSKYSFPKKGDVLISAAGTLGRTVVFDGKDAYFQDSNIVWLDIDHSKITNEYLYQCYQTIRWASPEGSTISRLYNGIIKKTKILLPPTLEEQRAIAAALSDMDALLDGLERLIAKKRDIKQATMQQLLTGKTRLPGFTGAWEVKRLGDVLTIRHGKNQATVSDSNGEYPILATGGKIGTATRWLYNKPSVLIGRKGTIDQPQYMDTPFWTVDTLFYSELKGENSAKFYYYCFCLIDWMQYNEASGVPSLNARTIEAVEVAYPAPEEQIAIANILSDMDAELSALEARRDKTRQIKQAMMQELLTGKTRLV